jgi:hypothetical protein
LDPQHCCITVEVVFPVWGTAHHSEVMSAFGRRVATELGLQRPVVWVWVVDMVAFLRFGRFVFLCLVGELEIVACDAGMEEEPYLGFVRRGSDGLDIDQCRSNVCDAIAKGEMVTE